VKTLRDTFRRIKVGVVANEFFGREVGGYGGFGWATRQVARLFAARPDLGFEAVFLNRTLPPGAGGRLAHARDTRLITRDGGCLADIRGLRSARPDLLLMIDYRPSYRFFAAALPMLFATPAPSLAAKVPGTYGVTPPEVNFLPNPVELDHPREPKSERPLFVFLARLDPLKRPWLFAELAGRFPEAEFLFMGHKHFDGEGSWRPEGLPPNVRLLGHVDGAEKWRLLSSAWALVNTAISEGLAVSFLEAFACSTPVVSCQNPEEVVSRFGVYVGRHDGDGRASLPRFAEALARLMSDSETRLRLGREGRAWVERTHGTGRFLEAFRSLCMRAGLNRSPAAVTAGEQGRGL
jgi:glycosyltransferase involved in cell wall biosynthesis